MISQMIPIFNLFDFFGAITLIPLHAYFDIVSGCIQTVVFTLLTMMYWKMEADESTPAFAEN
jgi:F0F1-type ATP synthase membrane subunit a